jgi:hypothetical protein
MDAVPLFPSVVAVMVAVPFVSAVTCPVLETVATFDELVDHANDRPVTVCPLAAFGIAES